MQPVQPLPFPPLAARAAGLSESEVRALFSVASRPDVVSLAGGMPDVRILPAEHVAEIVARVVRRELGRALQYCGGAGLPETREAAAELMAMEGIHADPGNVLITAGGQQALDTVAKVFLDPGDRVVVEGPSYVGAISAFSAYEPRFLAVGMDDDGMIVEDLAELFAGGVRPKFVYTVPSFSNPAGVTMSYTRRLRLISLCREHGVPIVEDNPYGMLRFEGEPLPTLHSLDPENVVYIGSASKVFAPGFRVGWTTARPGLFERLLVAKEAEDLCSSAFGQLTVAAYVRSEHFAPNLAGYLALYRERRDAMLAALEAHFPEGATWTRPRGGFYVWAGLPDGLDAKALLPEAVERRVAYVPGTAFYPDGRGRDRMRLSFCYPTVGEIHEGIRRLGELLCEQTGEAASEAASA